VVPSLKGPLGRTKKIKRDLMKVIVTFWGGCAILKEYWTLMICEQTKSADNAQTKSSERGLEMLAVVFPGQFEKKDLSVGVTSKVTECHNPTSKKQRRCGSTTNGGTTTFPPRIKSKKIKSSRTKGDGISVRRTAAGGLLGRNVVMIGGL